MADNTTTILDLAESRVMCFYNSQNEKIGELDFSGAKLKFTGDADESAQVFMKVIGRDLSEMASAARALVAQLDVGDHMGPRVANKLDELRKVLK